jgi:hypothetical protein
MSEANERRVRIDGGCNDARCARFAVEVREIYKYSKPNSMKSLEDLK